MTRTQAVRENDLKSFVTLDLGSYKTGTAYLEALNSEARVLGWARDILTSPHFVCAKRKNKVDLVAVRLQDIEVEWGARFEEIKKAGLARGLKFCPPEVGPLLRLALKKQTEEEWAVIMMEPISGFSRSNRVFSLGVDNRSHVLSAIPAQDIRARNDYYIFVKPRIKK